MTLLLQVTAVAAILVGPIAVLASFLNEEIEKKYPVTEYVFFINSILLLLAFLGIYLFQVDETGEMGLLGFIAILIGSMFSMFPDKVAGMQGWEFGGLFIALGTILFAIATYSAGLFPQLVPIAFAAGILFGIPSIFVKSYQRLGYILGAVGFGLGTVAAGIFMLAA
ncbi:MAG: hypothetical protein OEV06_10925 [Anaerolineae bacterium]|nr:hypothetical protein [Anaerolineae bacterium]